MSQKVFSVFLPDRRSPIRIEADSFHHYGCEMALHKGEVMVARSSDRGFVVRDDLVLDFDSVDQIAPLAVSEIKAHPAPVWPFLAGAGTALAILCVAASWLV
ncbi:hypothetical protein [Pseudomonas chlororaphis]|uniref:hypothetical protein n=1 Tax=Pseudomonas chlororaphis TaxID=587753 RepID=UPI0011D0980B|nr:hypothetical protein [Pseudomonas chlororaphis]